jgi:hypothetical protein
MIFSPCGRPPGTSGNLAREGRRLINVVGMRSLKVRPLWSATEVSAHLVGAAAFKAVGTGDPCSAGSIPVHLRHQRRARRFDRWVERWQTVSVPKLYLPRALRLDHDRFGVLFALILLLFLTSGVNEPAAIRVASALLSAAVLIVAFRSTGLASSNTKLTWVVVIAASVALVRSFFDPSFVAGSVALLVQAALVLAVVVTIARRLLGHDRVSLETIMGALCIYTLVGLMFADIYGSFDTFFGGNALQVNDGGEVDPLYYSFTVLTTLGFGDITSVQPLIRRISVIEAMFGQMFLATTVARLVSLYGFRAHSNQVDSSN